jgi:hypothetical protein
MLFGKNPAKMTVEKQLEYLVRKLGSRFMAPMFRAGFTHFNIAAVLARAAVMGNQLAEQLVEEAERKI